MMIEDLQGVYKLRNQIQKLLDSDLSSLHISKQTGVPQSTIHRMRKNERSLDNMSLKTLNYFINLPMVYLVMKIKKNN